MKQPPGRFSADRYLRYYRYFYRYLGYRVWIALFGSLLVALLDGVGLTLFLPLLEAAGGGLPGSGGSLLGGMAVVVDGLARLGIPLTLTSVLVLIVVLFTLKGLARYAAEYYRVVMQQRFINTLRLQNMALLAGYDYPAFTGTDSGRIQNSFSGEVNQVANAYRVYFQLLQALIMLAVYVGLACLANPRFALLVGLGGLASNLLFGRLYGTTKKASRALTAENHRFQGFLIQSVASFKFLKATNLIERYRRRIDASVVAIERHQRRVGQMNAIGNASREPVTIAIVVVAILLQVVVFGSGFGGMILSMLFLYRGLGSLAAAQSAYTQFLGLSGSMENLQDFERELRAHQEPTGGRVPGRLRRQLEVRNLSYDYGRGAVLRNLDLTIRRHETVGVVGESGAGKTTLANVLAGLLRVPPGVLFLDGEDVSELDLRRYRDRIGYVTQEPHVYADTILNNVAFWDERVDEDRVWRALEQAHAAAFVRALPEQLHSRVGDNGVTLSGGQRQRLSIARELYRDVDLLILDEATSALDSQSESTIRENIEALSGHRTLLVIAHRLSTVRRADKIIYLQPGGKYAVGTFAGLQRSSATFRELVSLQSVG